MKTLLLLSLLLLANGCTGLAKVTKALAKDPATVAVKINTLYGTASLVRIGGMPTNSTATVSPDGTISIRTN